ncbi:MAG: hypothetical protein FWB85_11950, partial [Chitinispirillia bacterium]|nr:hypothetical protein [Chitinispirillia bacterium]MCL2242822.1 hypothetical protein [Chitinispirillia bacterium]
ERYDYEQWMRAGQPGPMPTVHREVRVRDYFFTAGFMYFGMWIGMAACCLLHALYSAKDAGVRAAAPAAAAILVATTVIPAAANYNLSTRAGDWVAYDYAYNLLNSCEENGIIFTNGDNDTFPLWALQEAYGVRKDVRIVNLSLVNTDWYIKQLKKLEPRVPISFTDDEIAALEPRLNPFSEPRLHTLKNANLTFFMPGAQTQRVLRVQDRMVLNIVDANGIPDSTRHIRLNADGAADTTISVTSTWQKPIYFAMTVSDDNLMGLTPFLRAEGLVYRLMPQKVTPDNHYELARSLHMVDSVFSLRGIGKAKANNTSRRLLTNYLQIAFDLRRSMENLRRTGSPDYASYMAPALKFLDKCVELMPWDWRTRAIRHEFYMDNDMANEAKEAMEQAFIEDPQNISQYYQQMLDQAIRALESGQTGKTAQPPEVTSELSPEQIQKLLQEAAEKSQEQEQKGGES